MITVHNLGKRYGDHLAIEGVEFEVGRGEVVGFLGPNGAGKTTTMRIVCGCIGASEGRVRVAGHDVLEEPLEVKRRIGYLPEVPPLYGNMTVRDFVRFAAVLRGVRDDAAAADRTIARVGLESVRGRLVSHLSKGYRQRVGIAQALVHDPEVLVLDEPTSGLDPAQRVEIRELLRELAAGERTVILSTHVLAEIEAVCKRLVIINRGRLVAQGTLQELALGASSVLVRVEAPVAGLEERLRTVPGVIEVTTLDASAFRVRAEGDVRAALAREAVTSGLVELRAEGGLEEVYLRLTKGEA